MSTITEPRGGDVAQARHVLTWSRGGRLLLGAMLWLSPLYVIGGCGCSWGSDVSAVTVAPETACLQIAAHGSCADVELSGVNNCSDPLLFPTLSEQFAAGASFSVRVGSDRVVTEDEESCVDHFEVPARLGDQDLTLRFWVEAVNRGAFGC